MQRVFANVTAAPADNQDQLESPVQRRLSERAQSAEVAAQLRDVPSPLTSDEPAVLQAKELAGSTSKEAVRARAKEGLGQPATSLPHLDRVQASFGDHPIGDVRAHIGGDATKASEDIGAKAYTMGEDVALPSQPDLRTVGHEAAHVVQQRAGVQVPGGVGTSGDTHERQADAVAERVVQGRSCKDLLPASTGATTALQKKDSDGQPGGPNWGWDINEEHKRIEKSFLKWGSKKKVSELAKVARINYTRTGKMEPFLVRFQGILRVMQYNHKVELVDLGERILRIANKKTAVIKQWQKRALKKKNKLLAHILGTMYRLTHEFTALPKYPDKEKKKYRKTKLKLASNNIPGRNESSAHLWFHGFGIGRADGVGIEDLLIQSLSTLPDPNIIPKAALRNNTLHWRVLGSHDGVGSHDKNNELIQLRSGVARARFYSYLDAIWLGRLRARFPYLERKTVNFRVKGHTGTYNAAFINTTFDRKAKQGTPEGRSFLRSVCVEYWFQRHDNHLTARQPKPPKPPSPAETMKILKGLKKRRMSKPEKHVLNVLLNMSNAVFEGKFVNKGLVNFYANVGFKNYPDVSRFVRLLGISAWDTVRNSIANKTNAYKRDPVNKQLMDSAMHGIRHVIKEITAGNGEIALNRARSAVTKLASWAAGQIGQPNSVYGWTKEVKGVII